MSQHLASTSLAHSTSQNSQQPTQPVISDQIANATNSICAILKNTVWPRRSADAAQRLALVFDNARQLKNIPREDKNCTPEQRTHFEHTLRTLESVLSKLQEVSSTYGAKEKKLGNRIKYLFTYLDRDRCTDVLESCRLEVEDAVIGLRSHSALNDGTMSIRADHEEPERLGTVTQRKAPSQAMSVEWGEMQTLPPIDTTGASSGARQMPEPTGKQSTSVRPGQESSDLGRRDRLSAARKTLDVVQTISGTIPVVGSYVGAAAQVGVAIVSTLQSMDSNQEVLTELESSTTRLVGLLKRLDKKTVEHQKEETTTYINDMISQLKSIQDQIKTLSSSSTFKKLVAADGRADTLKGHQETIRTALEETQLLVSLNAADLLQELYDAEIRKEQRRLLNCLGDANYGAKGDAVEDVICLPGTRAGTIGRIDEWIRDTETSERVLWIRGTAGRGKSTIASTVAYRWRYRAACAIFHFRRGQSSLDKRFVCALARQLGSTAFLEIKNSVQKSIKENEDIAQERLQEQFKTLLVGSLERLEDNHLSILLVIDALDECESTESAVNFIKLVDRYLPSLPVNVKFLLTSRPEAPLMRVLEPRPWHAEDLDMMKDVDEDIEKFIEFGLSKVKTEHDLGEDWPPPDTVSTLVRMSQGLFQWADTAIRYMMEGLPHHRLQELLQSPSVCDGLDPLYLQILGKASKKAAKSRTQGDLFHRTLGAIVVSPYPISLDVMGFIFAEHEMLKGKSQKTVIELLRWEILLDLTSLIHIPRDSTSPVQLVHTSVRDLLIDKIRCGDVPCWINLDQNHQNLTSEYLRLMNRDLKTNICKLSDLSKANSDPEVLDLVKLYVPSGLQHCCRTWSIHLTACPQKSDQVLDGLEKFSKNQLLRWIEVMSLLGKTGESQAAAKQVKEYLSSSNPLLLELWSDTYRFIIAFHEPISFGALHIYASALPFCPTETALRRHYHDNATARLVNSSQDLTWPMELWSRHVEPVGYSLAIGVGGSMIAYSTIDNTIRLCSLESGTPVDRPLIHDGGHPMIFSPDGKAIVSVSPDDMIHFRDAETGEPLRAPLDGHGEIIRSIAFSPNGKILAAGSRYQTMRLWDAESGLILGEPLTGHSDAVSSVAFSRDSAILASGSDDGTVRFWDLKTGAPTGRPLEGHESAVNSVSFSPTSAVLATASDDKTIRLWDLETKRQLGEPLRRHSDNVYVAVFSPSGEVLASASRDMTICLWNVERGSLIGEPLAGHSGAVFSVAFSPNGQSLASLSSDQTIRLWDVGAKESLVKDKSEIDTPNRLLQNSPTEEHPLGHANVVNSVDFAPDGRILASGSNDETIRLWEVESGKPIGSPLTLHTDWVNCVAFSPDGEVLASASYDKTVRIWCARTGEPQREPLQHESPVMFVTFSADGTILAAGLADGEIWLWNTRTWESMGEPLYTGTSRPGPCGIFLSDASGEIVLVVGWKETTEIQFWDLKTRRKRGEFSSSSTTMKFSLLPDGRLIRTDEEGLSSLVRCSDFPASLATSLPTTTEGTSKPCLTSSSPLLLGYEGQWVTFLSHRLFWLVPKYWICRYTQPNWVFLTHGRLIVINDEKFFFFDVSRALGL